MQSLPEGITMQVFYDNELYFQSSEHWLKPLYDLEDFLTSYPVKDRTLLTLHDSVDGRAAAMLTWRLGIKKVCSDTISRPAVSFFEKNGVQWFSLNVIDRIKCRTEDSITDYMDPDFVRNLLKMRLD